MPKQDLLTNNSFTLKNKCAMEIKLPPFVAKQGTISVENATLT